MSDIARKQNVSIHKIVYWMEKYGIIRRSSSEATYVKRNPNGNPFKITPINTREKSELLALGIALYLGEGDKKAPWAVRLANSDPRIINIFLKFLRVICEVKLDKIKASLNIFDDLIYKDTIAYWSKQTGIPLRNFCYPVIRPRKEGTYKNKSKYGTLTILVLNKKLLYHIRKWSEEFLRKYSSSNISKSL